MEPIFDVSATWALGVFLTALFVAFAAEFL